MGALGQHGTDGRHSVLNGVVAIPVASPFRPGSAPSGAPHSAAFSGSRNREASLRAFLAGAENLLAVEVVQTLLRPPLFDSLGGPRARVSPLVLHGPSGVGKSHLALGLAEAWRTQQPDVRMTVTNGADFARQYAAAVDSRTVPEWRDSVRLTDVLVVDDLAPLAAKNAAQIELQQALDILEERDAQAVFTTRVLPVEIPGLLPSLVGRLVGGLLVSLSLPSEATRRAIVADIAALRGIALEDTAADALAAGMAVSVPELQGCLLYLQTSARLEGVSIDAERVRQYLADGLAPRVPSLRGIAAQSARHFALRVTDLRSASRRRAVVLARDVAMYLARQLTDKTLEQIGAYFGGRDHTTVLHGCRKIEEQLRADPELRAAVDQLRSVLVSP